MQKESTINSSKLNSQHEKPLDYQTIALSRSLNSSLVIQKHVLTGKHVWVETTVNVHCTVWKSWSVVDRNKRPENNSMKWRMASSGMLRRVALVETDVSEEFSASFIRVTRIGELGRTLVVTSNRGTLQRNTLSPWWRRPYITPKRLSLQEPHGVTSQKTPFLIVNAVKTSNLT
jgi:hypothetical protein